MSEAPPFYNEVREDHSPRYVIMAGFMLFLFFILGGRLWYLQVIKGSDFRGQSELNRTERVELPPLRGLILDRNGTVLADNEATFNLCVQKSEVEDIDLLIAEVAALTGRDSKELRERYQNLPRSRYQHLPWVLGLSREELIAIETRRFWLSGVSIQVSNVRRPTSDSDVFASHVIGYLGEIGKRQLESGRFPEHRAGDLIGQSGLEQSQEIQLKGIRGSRVQEVDSRGRVLREIESIYPEPGHNVRLTLDSRLQRVAQALLAERAGAIVVMDPRNFEILALASSPTFSLGDFVGGISAAKWHSLMDDAFHPMENRAVAGQYPPGSTFKIVVALVALAQGVITPDTIFVCRGGVKLGNHTFGCWNRGGHGPLNLRDSLKHSCDVYYYEVGRRLGVDKLAEGAREIFGLGSKIGVELLAEQAGLIPDSAWKKRRFDQNWMPGETLPVSIGQGYVLCSPLQVAQFTAVLANGGRLYRPHLIKEILDVSGQVIRSIEPELIHELDLAPEYIKAVQDGVVAVVNEGGGTGRRAALPDRVAAGKTGTSQVVSLKRYQGYSRDAVPYKYRDHAWFTSYAPAENPEVVVTVLLEHAGGGGANAAPVARKMLAAYFDSSVVADELPPPQVQPDQPAGWSPGL